MAAVLRGTRTCETRLTAGVALATLCLLVLSISVLGTGRASAAPGDPFDPLVPNVFVAQNDPTGLFRAVAGPGGTVTFAPEGSASTVRYNAIGYNTSTNFLYGVVATGATGFPTGAVIRIGEAGVITRVGTSTAGGGNFNWGAVLGNSLYAGFDRNASYSVINTTTGAVTATGTLSAAPHTADLTYANGYFWGVNDTGGLVRVDLLSAAATKPVTVFPIGLPNGPYGAAWTFGNGNIGVSNNSTGNVRQLAIANPGSATPTITVVSTAPGPASSNNDGAASPGGPTDLSIDKSAPTSYDAGGTLTYTVTVTNNGPSVSTGSVVKDLIPSGLANVATTAAGCTVANNDVTCTVGQLTAGASRTIQVTADTPGSATACFTNTASVLANEVDPDPGNNSSSVTSCPRALEVTKTSDATGSTRPGDTVTYTVTARNIGVGSYTTAEPAVLFDDLSGILDDATFDGIATADRPGVLDYTAPKLSWTGALGPGESVSVRYSVVTGTGGDGRMRNVAFVPNDPDDPQTPDCSPPTAGGRDPDTGEPCATTTVLLPSLTVVKTADRATVTAAGETITYRYRITNTGGTVIAPATVAETVFSGTGVRPVATCPDAAASLAPGASVTCTATYLVTQADIDSRAIVNTAVATGTPPEGPPVVSPPSTATVDTPVPPLVPPGPPSPPGPPNAPRYDLQMTKRAPRRPVTVGATFSYRLVATNLGPDAADGVRVTDALPSDLELRDARTPQGSCTVRGNDVDCAIGKLDAGQSVTVTVRATALRIGTVSNTARVVPPPPPDGVPVDPPGNNTGTATVRIVDPQLRVRKGASRSRLRAGETVTYTIRVSNPSGRAVRDVRTCDRLPAGLVRVSSRPTAKLSRGRYCWTARTLGPRETATYRLTARALSGTSGRKVNVAQATSPDARSGRATRAVRVTRAPIRVGGVTG